MSTQPAWSEQEAELEALRLQVEDLERENDWLRESLTDMRHELRDAEREIARLEERVDEGTEVADLVSAARSEHYERHPLDMRFCDVSPVCRIAWAMGA